MQGRSSEKSLGMKFNFSKENTGLLKFNRVRQKFGKPKAGIVPKTTKISLNLNFDLKYNEDNANDFIRGEHILEVDQGTQDITTHPTSEIDRILALGQTR